MQKTTNYPAVQQQQLRSIKNNYGKSEEARLLTTVSINKGKINNPLVNVA
jgi:hypothetical protein